MRFQQITVFLLLYLIFLVGLTCSQSEPSPLPTFNSFYERWIHRGIVAPFLKAYKLLNKNVIGKILTVKANSNARTIKSLLHNFQCQFDDIVKQLRRAKDACQKISAAYDGEVLNTQLKINKQEEKTHLKGEEVNATKVKLEEMQRQLKLNEDMQRDYQQSADNAQREVSAAQQALRDNGDCRRRRRKKHLTSVLCSIFGGAGEDNALERIRLAARTRHNAQHRLQVHQQSLGTHQFQYNFAISEYNNTITELHRLQSQLNQTRYAYEYIATLSGEFKNINTYILEVFDSSDVFKTQLMDLMDFENVIDPLNDIYQKIIDNRWITLHNGKDSMGIISLTNSSLEKARERLQTWDVFFTDQRKTRKSCLFFDDK